MITRVEISGFKTFTDFSVDLAPLSVIAGANASGKSNFLDALQIIKGLATGKTLEEANERRGSAATLFTNYGEGKHADKMSFAVELLIPLKEIVTESNAHPISNRLRYELEIANDPFDRQFFLVLEERLSVIGSQTDSWAKEHFTPDIIDQFVQQPPYPGGGIMNRSFLLQPGQVPANHVSSSNHRKDVTWLSGQTNGKYPLASTVKRYFENQHFIDLNAVENFSNFDNPKSKGSLILRELRQMARDRPEDVSLLSLQVSTIAKEVRKVKVDVDNFNRVSVIGVNRDGAEFIPSNLSEGTLRTIALCALLYSEAPQRTILLEEPENGIDPRALRKFIEVLSDMVISPDDPTEPMVQVICTTHSPIVLDLVVNDDNPQRLKAFLATTYSKAVTKDGAPPTLTTTAVTPVVRHINKTIPESRLERATLGQAKQYLRYGPAKEMNDA